MFNPSAVSAQQAAPASRLLERSARPHYPRRRRLTGRPPAGTTSGSAREGLSADEGRPDARRSGGSAADAKVELYRQVSVAECLPGVGEGFGFDALMQGVQVG